MVKLNELNFHYLLEGRGLIQPSEDQRHLLQFTMRIEIEVMGLSSDKKPTLRPEKPP